MNSEFRISKIVLENYRQYYGIVTVDFSPEGQFTIFLGENGEGKSNLLNAINWCLFHEEPHKRKNKTLPIINTKYLEELHINSRAEMRVTIYLDRESTAYKISRLLVGTKNNFQKSVEDGVEVYDMVQDSSDPIPVGFEIIPHMCTTSFLKSTAGGTWEDQTKQHMFDSLVGQIIPKSLSKFFILDGEFLEQMFNDFQYVEDGIIQISQIKILKDILSHIHLSKLGTNRQGFDTDMDKLNKKIMEIDFELDSKDTEGKILKTTKPIWGQDDKFYHQSGIPRLNDLKDASNSLDIHLKEIMEKIHNSNAITNVRLQEDMQKLEHNISDKNNQMDKTLSAYRDLLIHVGPKIMITDVLKNATDLINVQIDKGTLPNHAKMTFTTDLLEKGTCLCGTRLDQDSTARKNVEQIRDQVSADVGLDIANEMKYINSDFFMDSEKIIEEMDSKMTEIHNIKTSIVKLKEEYSRINNDLKNASSHDYAKLLTDRDNITAEKEDIDMKIGSENTQIIRCNDDRKELVHKLTNLETRNERAKKQQHQIRISESIKDIVNNAESQISKEIRLKVQEKTTEFFKSIIWKEGYFEKIIIDEKYNLKLITIQKFNATEDLSAGEKLFLTLSFIAALREITGYKFPLIIDTPLGKISGSPRKLLGTKLPDFLPKSQLTLLATDTEYISPIPDINTGEFSLSFKELLKEKIKVNELRIKFNEETFCSKIIDYHTESSA